MLSYRPLAEHAGASLAAILSYMLAKYAKPVSADTNPEEGAGLTTDATMRSALAALVFLTGLLSLILAWCMFKEIPIEQRRQYRRLKRQLKDSLGLEQQVLA